ncbi:MAG: efflux RND transporter periplasmic adaptor subunit [Armatimonadetes bacterium]|nr:efflux RND transporter periplasmic adaptor subunit [Armatimonadota bacterium]
MRCRDLTIWAVLALALALASGCGRRPAAENAEAAGASVEAAAVSVAQAVSGEIRLNVPLTGTVEAWREVDVQGEVAGKVAWVGPDVGDRVAAGAPLVRLDTALAAASRQQSVAAAAAASARYGQTATGLKLTKDETTIGVRQAEKNVESARNRLAQAKTSAKLTRTRVEDAIEQARIALNQARTRLAEVKAGTRTQEVAQARARVEQAQASLRLAKLSVDRARNLVQAGAVAQAQLDAAQVEYETAEAQVRIAQQALNLAEEGARTEQVRLAELAVSQAEQGLREAEAQRAQIDVAERDVRAAELAVDQAEEALHLARAGQRRVKASEQDLQAARANVGQAKAGVMSSTTQLRKHVIYAPISGIVAARNVEPGEGASPGVALMRIVNLDTVRVVAEASDLEVDRIRVGQRAAVRVDALPGEEFMGDVTDIAPQAGKDVRSFNVRIRIANPGHRLRAGMFARVDVLTGVRSQATIIPRDALVERGNERVVYTVVGGRVKVRSVRVGAIDGNRVEVDSGIRPGDTVIVSGQSLLADGQEVKPVDAAEQEQTTSARATGP